MVSQVGPGFYGNKLPDSGTRVAFNSLIYRVLPYPCLYDDYVYLYGDYVPATDVCLHRRRRRSRN
jgi:hypothetical protein